MIDIKKLIYFFFLLWVFPVLAQNAVHNFGTIQMHDNSKIGFHIDLENDGIFFKNMGLVGFYNTQSSLTVSGTSIPVFYDTEFMVYNDLYLDIGIGVVNNSNFISGNVITPTTDPLTYLNIVNEAFYIGTSDPNKVVGYAGMTNKENFVFPIGDATRLRPLTISSLAINAVASSAYFFEDPNIASTFPTNFDTSLKFNEDLNISTTEFWDLEAMIPSNVTLSWDSNSMISDFVEELSNIRVVGWSKSLDLWVDLGNTDQSGDFTAGTVTSDLFVPFDYEIITLGHNLSNTSNNIVNLGNYYLSPNADGMNDQLIIDGLDLSPNNNLKIFNRYGVLVYTKANYHNEFDGRSNVDMVIKRPDGLAAGIYFYTIDMYDMNQIHQGFLYISN
ncbi:MAG: gliding motility-associated C-terminal domain-containing protein [Flavobacteriaceae bacterium]|nr:gliding motility-associated C-terminal domain-containing protein [Flavobacteriaceae bacterium]